MKDNNSTTGRPKLNNQNDPKFIPSNSTKNLEAIRKKIQNGFYDLPTVKLFVAEKIVKSLTF